MLSGRFFDDGSNLRSALLFLIFHFASWGHKWAKWAWVILAVMTVVISLVFIVIYGHLFYVWELAVTILEIIFVVAVSIALFYSEALNAYTDLMKAKVNENKNKK